MSNPKNELTEKRRRSQNDEPPNKHPKSDPIEPTNMMDLNDDCLDHILRKLKHVDLLNVAGTSKRLMQAAQLAFKSKYRKHLVNLNNSSRYGTINIYGTEISINHFVSCLKFVRCFGQSISKLDVDYSRMSERQCVKLDSYIIEYCVSFVTELKLRGPYAKDCDSFEFIMVPIAQLEHLTVHVEDVGLESLKTCLRVNPQLKSLEIYCFEMDLQLLRIASECAQLKSLHMRGSYYDFSTNTKANPIQFKNVTKLTADGCFFDAMVSSNVAISFDHLDELEINWPFKDKYLLDFLSKHRPISKLKCHVQPGDKIMSDLAKVLPSVTEAIFLWGELSVNVAIDFVNECKLLKKFVFQLAKRSEYKVLQQRLGKEWQTSIDESFIRVTLER